MDKAKKMGDKAKEVLATARDRLLSAMESCKDSRIDQLDDLRFAAGSPDNQWQWPSYAMTSRTSDGGTTSRPCLTINKIPQYIHQITNDQRQNRNYGNVIPANDEAHAEVALVYEGMIRHIGYTSDADVVYDTATESISTHGEGYFRLITEFSDEDSFDQDIKFERVQDPFSIYMDPAIKKQCGEDAEYCFILDNLPKDEFEDQFPDAMPISSLEANRDDISNWVGEDTVLIAEYFCYETTKRKLNQYPEDHTAFEGTPEDTVYRKHYGDPIKSRQSDHRQVKWYKINGFEILDERDWAGKYIPVIRVIGNEFLVEGQRYISGLVRNMKDAQRMYNYHASNEVEMIALAPKAPFIGYGGQFEGFEDKWKTANINPWPYLEVNPDVTDGNGSVLPLPQRAQPPMVQSGIISAKNAASQDMKEVTGLYNASLGEQGNERSGKAILARQHEGDVGTFHYVDNLSRAIRYGTRQLIDLIPKIYDTKRIARMLGEDNSTSTATLDSSQMGPDGKPAAVTKVVDQQGNVIKRIYNPSVGKYDVLAVTGPGFATARREAADSMSRVIEANPDLWKVAGDLFVKNMDWPGSQELASRLAKTIPPQLMGGDDENPALQQAHQQIQQLGQQLQQAHGMLQNVQNSMESKEFTVKAFEAQIKQYDAETKRISAMAAASAAAAQTKGQMSEEQVQAIVIGTMHAAVSSGHLMGSIPGDPMAQPTPPDPNQGPPQPQEQAPPLDPNKLMMEDSKHQLQANQHAHELAMQANQPQPETGSQ